MREINELSAKLLLRIYHQSRHDRVRQRAHCLLLRDREHKKFKELMEIFDVSYTAFIIKMRYNSEVSSRTLENHEALFSRSPPENYRNL
ncbi:MAG: hypothetical protein EBE86_027565 [Hormoscilla sp. GUM202]|nr:hypothetical protein [Hormoscilla sp. GUM202]